MRPKRASQRVPALLRAMKESGLQAHDGERKPANFDQLVRPDLTRIDAID